MKDYYKILGVLKTASIDEIKKAYRKLAREYHPDKTGGDEKKNRVFLDVNEAYEVLGNEDKRKNYDEKKPDNTSNNQTKKQSESGFTPNFDMNDFEKRFENFFGFNKSGEKTQGNSSKVNTDAMFNSFFNMKK